MTEEIEESAARHDILNLLTVVMLSLDDLIEESNENSRQIIAQLQTTAVGIENILQGKGAIKNIMKQIRVLQGLSLALSVMLSNKRSSMVYECSEKINEIINSTKECRESSLRSFNFREVFERESRPFNIDISIIGVRIILLAHCKFDSVIGNLFQNAIMHGKATFMMAEVVERSGEIVITITDNGIGIPYEDKEKIFKNGFTTKVGKPGGKGLAFCREFLEKTGASIIETGTPGKGARFEITIPKEDIIMIS
ncbi:MAG: HAMP domain-containing sensor histidine kinase [Candidatus Paceibacterota bacterium]